MGKSLSKTLFWNYLQNIAFNYNADP